MGDFKGRISNDLVILAAGHGGNEWQFTSTALFWIINKEKDVSSVAPTNTVVEISLAEYSNVKTDGTARS
jgi:hypothetical protein